MLTRAYSILTIKHLDAERRVLTGIASTPTPDRMDDIVDPLGVRFKNPVPLLLYHDARMPVGHVTFDAPTDRGITFTAQLATVPDAGTLHDRVEEAWQSVKSGLLQGVSIGFRAIDRASLKNGGIKFLKSELLELSLVSVPANADCTITAIKSFDTSSAASGGRGVGLSRPGVAGTPPKLSMKTYSEQTKEWEATRAAKSARMAELMGGASDKGETLDDDQTIEYDDLKAQVKKIDAHLVRLAELETSNQAAAKPVNGDTPVTAAASRGGHPHISVTRQLPPGIEMTRYVLCLASARGNRGEALEIAKSRYPDDVRIHNVLKAAVAAGTTSDPTWAGNLVDYQAFLGDFVDFTRPSTILGKFGTNGIPSLRKVPFNVNIKGMTSGGTAYWVGEGKPKPLTRFSVGTDRLGWAKVATITVLSDELIRFSSPSAEALARDEIRNACVERLDRDFVDPTKAAGAESPASVTYGVSAIPSSGTDADAVAVDIKALFAPYIAASHTPSTGVYVMSTTTALSLSLMMNALGQPEFPGISLTGGTFKGLPVIVSDYVAGPGSPAGGLVILVNAGDIWLADDGQVTIDASREASLEMDDAPSNSVGTGSPVAPQAAQLVSLWQTNSTALKAERYINWAKRRPTAVQYLDGVNWGAAA